MVINESNYEIIVYSRIVCNYLLNLCNDRIISFHLLTQIRTEWFCNNLIISLYFFSDSTFQSKKKFLFIENYIIVVIPKSLFLQAIMSFSSAIFIQKETFYIN